jgi:cytochrome P450
MTVSSPARTLPGPRPLAGIAGLRRQGFLDYVGALWQEHGDLFQVRLGSRALIFAIHPDAVAHVSVANRQNYDKLGSYESVRRYLLGRGVLASTGDLWRRQRRLMAPFYTPRGVQAYAGLMLDEAAGLAERWAGLADAGAVVEVADEMTAVTAAIILKAMFSMERPESIVEMKEAVEALIGFTSARQKMLLPLPVWAPTAANRRYAAARRLVHDYIGGLIAARRATPETAWPDDLLSRLMRARDEETGEAMPADLLRDEAITTFFAGHETTARTLTFAWYALAANPAVAARLHAELDAVLGDGELTLDALRQLPYTLQVIKETLRLYPPAPFYIRDAVAGDTIGDHAVPAGGAIMLSPYYTHRHPDFWERPLAFDPDRWTPEREAARHPYAYHPFAAGQRICIGNNFSLLETHILLAALARRFAPRLVEGFTPRWVMQGTLGTANGMPMRIERRA